MNTTLNDKLEFGISCLNDAFNDLTNGDCIAKYQESLSVEFMLCVANVRFGICFAVDIIHQYYCCGSNEREKLPRRIQENLEKLNKSLQDVINKGIWREPRDFFLKQIVRQYGFPHLEQLSNMPQFKWLDFQKSKVNREFLHYLIYK